MTEEQRNEASRLRNQGRSERAIARSLGVSRGSVRKFLARLDKQRQKGVAHPELSPRRARRPSILDRFGDDVASLLSVYPDITAVRLHEELRGRGFAGGYSIVKDYLREKRPRPTRSPVVRFETEPGLQAQMDYSPYDLVFSRGGLSRVHAFSYVLSYSRRQYLHFVERQDLPTTLQQHLDAFRYFGGLASTCLYDNMKLAVLRWQDGLPVYNRRFLGFATHYGYRPWACVPYRSQTKGKVERPFDYIEKNLLNGRTFVDRDDLNRVTRWWLNEVADKRVHRETRERPIDRFERERPHLLPLPAGDYDTAEVVYRFVDAEGFIAYQTNRYSVPWQRIGQFLPVRVGADVVTVYASDLTAIARHPRLPDGARKVSALAEHRPDDRRQYHEQLRERFHELGPTGQRFMDGLVESHRYAYREAARVLSLLALYAQDDLVRALERAARYQAHNSGSVERILAAQARPRVQDGFGQDLRRHLDSIASGAPLEPRPGSEYDQLFNSDNETDDAEPTNSQE